MMKPLLNRNPNVTITRSPHCSFKFVVFVCCSGKIYGSWTCEMYKYSRPDYLKKKSRYSEILFFQRHTTRTTPSFTQPEQTSVTTIKHYIFIYLFLKYVNLLLVKLYFIFIFYISIFQYSASGITLPVKIKSNQFESLRRKKKMNDHLPIPEKGEVFFRPNNATSPLSKNE